MRVLLDNDVVLDFLLRREPFFPDAQELLIRGAKRELEIFISAITPINCFYIIRKAKDRETARQAVVKLLRIVKVCRVDRSILKDAFSLDFDDFEDAVRCSSAVRTRLEAIITRNLKDFENAALPVYSPGDFIKFLKTGRKISLGP
jgi:predicted nucleic acid-binding protein